MMTTEILSLLKGVKQNGNGWIAQCPAHDDKKASLSISEGKDGRTLVHCHAGCATEQIVAAMGLKMGDLFPPRDTPAKVQSVKSYDYTDDAGKLLYQVCRFQPKGFRQRRPDGNGGWVNNMDRIKRVLYRLPKVIETVKAGQVIYVVEGEKDADALVTRGLCATCNPGGAGKWQTAYTATLAGAQVIIIADKDEPGRKHAQLVAGALHGKAASVKVFELPDRNGCKVKDVANWIDAGGTLAELQTLAEAARGWTPAAEKSTTAPAANVETKGKSAVLLPHGTQSISDTGRSLGILLAKTERFFIRGGVVVKLAHDPDGLPHLEDVRPVALASDFESVAFLCKPDGPDDIAAVTCSEQTAKMIAAATTFRDAMLPIHVLTRCPVLFERAGSLIQISGYDRESGIYAAGLSAEPMDINEARRLLFEILAGFRFAAPADRARALAAMVTPALVFGGLLKGRAPVDLGEADASQTGKGYRNKLTAALYAQSVKTVTQQRSGVGSMEESFNMALIRGANFIALDNIRGKIDSPSFESFMTEEIYLARAPYREPVEIDPRRVVVMLTSNKADITTDLANRSACVRILKQPDGYVFRPYPEGDILEHVRAEQPRYLGAVFAIVRAWHEAGKPRTTETKHDFRPWAQTLDWITRNLLDAGPLLDGHRDTQARMTNPVLNWLRDVALEVIHAQQVGAWLRASDLVDLIAESGTETPGLPENGDLTDPAMRENAQRATGRKLGLCFKAGDHIVLDGMTIERREKYESESRYTVREYRFTTAAIDGDSMPASPSPASNLTPEPVEKEPEIDLCGHGRGHAAAIEPAIKPLCATIAAITPLQCEYSESIKDGEGVNIDSMGTYGRMAAAEDDINHDFDLAATPAADQYEEGEI